VLKTTLFTAFCALSFISSANVFKADQFFKDKQYDLAEQEYSKSASVGSPHAYYQLGTMYYKGLGVNKNELKALFWLSLAAEQNFGDSQSAVKNILQGLPATQETEIKRLLTDFKESHGKDVIEHTYFPQINTKNLTKQITFGGEGQLENIYQDPEMFSEISNDLFSDDPFESGSSSFDDELSDAFGSGTGSNDPAVLLGRRPPIDFTKRPYFLIVDHDVGKDGSFRNISSVQSIGYTRKGLDQIKRNTLAQPTFEEKRVEFFGRTYLGTATYNKFRMREANEPLYNRLKRLAKKLKVSSELEDQFQYAMALTSFTWLPQEKDEANNILKKLANNGHPKAQFEYGYMLYREQKDVLEAIHWISESSKYGYAKAEYVLAKILQSSPWVVKDELKALFWYESAMEKKHIGATLKAIEIKLLADNNALHNIPETITLLNELEESESGNPEYNFLLAISHKNREQRDFSQVMKYINRAIDLGSDLNWDVSYWENLRTKWTTGTVHIID
jgi:TPR repeat protein